MKAEPGVSRQAALIPLYGVVDKKPRPLVEELLIVGRARGCDIILDAPDVSSLHCVIYRWGDGWRMRDCGSRTGTRINGDPRKAAPLHDGDIVQIGPFSFNVSLPADHPGQTAALGLKEQRHLQASRRRLAQRAISLRRRLHQVLTGEPDSLQKELRQKASGLRARIRTYDQRVVDLENADASAPKAIRGESDLENYEAELTQYRQQLESDRAKFNKEIDQLRLRNQELDEATREMELELSRERAEMAREPQRLDRLREEIRSEQERISRDGGVRESLAPVQKLREEMNQKKGAGAKNQNDPMRTLRNRG